jgi:hypothetical protein
VYKIQVLSEQVFYFYSNTTTTSSNTGCDPAYTILEGCIWSTPNNATEKGTKTVFDIAENATTFPAGFEQDINMQLFLLPLFQIIVPMVFYCRILSVILTILQFSTQLRIFIQNQI